MPELLFGLIVVNVALFGYLGVQALRHARSDPSPRLRMLAWLVGAVCGAFLLSALQRMAIQAMRAGWVSQEWGRFFLSEWQLLQSLAATGLAVWALLLGRRVWGHLRRSERMVTVLTDRVAMDVSVTELGLTARELEILEAIASGKLADQEIAQAFYISPATAGTHVRNIMRKAGVRNRRDLMLLGSSDNGDQQTA